MSVSTFNRPNSGTDDYYAREADRIARGPQLYGGNAQVAALRCFKRYHKDSTTDITDLWGRTRWMTHKQAAIHGVLLRSGTSGERTTMSAIASEVGCCVSTVSRAIWKIASWGIIAVDVTRGRHGGIRVRLRSLGDDLQAYTIAAWERVKRAAIKVASTFTKRGEGLTSSHLVMDATFTEACDGRCTNLLDCSTLDHTPLAPSAASRAADQEQARAAEFARQFFIEVRRLDDEGPDWDLQLEKIRASYGWV
jgi:hypothetical protein